MEPHTTHPSVRIRGTENNYEPIQCVDPGCGNRVGPHMHCPFCVKNESYLDPVILKAHYRVKHVDKGIEFAGLKILRCCDHCDIVGTIKGVKEFKGAHWHCYKCKNGFNRRDEAIKHYRTHFRNPQTTFQIQITEEVNQMMNLGNESDSTTQTICQDDFTTIHPALTEAVMTTASVDTSHCSPESPSDNEDNATYGLLNIQPGTTLANGKSGDNEVHVSVAANETVGSEGQTIMIIHEEQLDTAGTTLQVTNMAQQGVHVTGLGQGDASKKVVLLQQKNSQLELEKSQLEQQLQGEIDQLKLQVQMQAQEIANYQKREQELLNQLSIPLDDRIQELLVQLKTDHEDLLHQQLAQLRRTYVQQFSQQMGQTVPILVTENVENCVEADRMTAGHDLHSTMAVSSAPNILILSAEAITSVSEGTANGEERTTVVGSLPTEAKTCEDSAAASVVSASNAEVTSPVGTVVSAMLPVTAGGTAPSITVVTQEATTNSHAQTSDMQPTRAITSPAAKRQRNS